MRGIGRDKCRLQVAVCCMAACCLLVVSSATAQVTVDPGQDCFTTGNACDGSSAASFGTPSSPPIPLDFFGPGSDPFEGTVALQGAIPGEIDTRVDRLETLELPLSGACVTTATQLVELNLVGCAPITVTYNGGQDPEDWDVAVGLSLSKIPVPNGTLGACLDTDLPGTGGHISFSLLNVLPRYVFTKVADPGTQAVLDTGDEGYDPITIDTPPLPWQGYFLAGDSAADSPCDADNFYAGATIVRGEVCCEEICHDDPDGYHPHCVLPPGCVICPELIPTVSEWGLIGMALLVFAAATFVFSRRPQRA